MNIDVLYKVIGYAGIYKSLGKTVNSISADDMTISVFRHRYPREMLTELKKEGADIVEEAPGIYRVDGIFHIPIRVIVTSKLGEEYAALRILTVNAAREDFEQFVEYAIQMKGKNNKENIEVVLEISTAANSNVYKQVKEGATMGPALMELMSEELTESWSKGRAEGHAEGRAEGHAEGRAEGVRAVVDLCKSLGGSSVDAVEQIISKMGYTQEEADQLVLKYW